MSDYSSNRYGMRSRICQFCSNKDLKIDYKNAELLNRLVDDTGKIRPRRQTGTCAKHQRAVAKAIKNARHIALLPFVDK